MTRISTDAQFEEMSWHDCTLWGIQLRTGDPNEGDWTSELVLDIDFITVWTCLAGGGGQFRIAPARLVFHEVTDLAFSIDWGRSSFQNVLHEVSIDVVARELVSEPKLRFDRPYYSWEIRMNWPQGGKIAFGALGFTQTLLAEPVMASNTSLSLRERNRLIEQSIEPRPTGGQ